LTVDNRRRIDGRQLDRVMLEASKGSIEAAYNFQRLGLNWRDFVKMTPEQKIEKIADALRRFQNPAQKAAIAQELLGGSASELIPLLSGGSAGIKELRAEAERLGLVMSKEDAAAAKEFSQAIKTLRATFAAIVNTIGSQVTPTLIVFVKTVSNCVAWVNDFLRKNKEIIQVVGLVAMRIAISGATMLALGIAIKSLAIVIGGLLSALAAIKILVAVVSGAFLFLISPIGLVTLAVVAAGASFLAFTDYGNKMCDIIQTSLREMFAFAKEVFAGISDAIAAGDLALAGKVAMAGLNVAWTEGIHKINDIWVKAKAFLIETWADGVNALEVMFTDLWANVQISWEAFIGRFKSSWLDAQGFVSKTALVIAKSLELATGNKNGIDLEEALKASDDITKSNKSATASGATKRITEIEKARKATQADTAEHFRDGKMDRASAYAEDLAKTREAARKAGEEFAKARQEAADKLAAGTEKKRKDLSGGSPGGLEAVRQKVSSVGTFAAQGISGLLSNGAMDKVAQYTKQTAEHTKQTLAEIRNKDGFSWVN